MLAWLMLVGGLHHATAAEQSIPKDTNYIVTQNASCPSSGFFFQRKTAPNTLDVACYLCFCQHEGTAVCWRRENRKCDLEHYKDFGQRNIRNRRSPLGFNDIFLRDAARDFFNMQSPEQCKPFESSFSDGCPPADWCIGCTVCDCDANGRWDCHILSFCTDKNGKKQMKKRRPPRNRHGKKQAKKPTTKATRTTKNPTKALKKSAIKRSANPNPRNLVKQSSAVSKPKISQVKATNVNKIAAVKKPLLKVKAKKATPSKNKVTRRPLYIKKNLPMNKPLNMKSKGNKSVKNNTIEVAQKVVKQFMSTMQKMFKNIDLKTDKTTTKQMNKVQGTKKRSMEKGDNTKGTNKRPKSKSDTKPGSNGNRKNIGKANTTKKTTSTSSTSYGRLKRHVTTVDGKLLKNDLNYIHKSNENKIDENGNINGSKNFNNSTSIVLKISEILNNKTTNFTLLKNSMIRDISITDNDIQFDNNKQGMTHDKTLYQSVNKTNDTILWAMDHYKRTLQNVSNNKVEDVTLVITDKSYLPSNYSESNGMNKNIGSKQILQAMESRNDTMYPKEKEYSNASTQTKSHNCKFRNLLQKLIGTETDHYNFTKERYETAKKPKRYTVLTKIKRLFKKIFSKKYKNTFHHNDDIFFNDSALKQFGYKKPKNNKLDLNVKEKLRQRIYELKSESEKILKIIGIIKGLLHILEMNTNDRLYNVSRDFSGSNRYFEKLKIIVKNTYHIGDDAENVTEDQRTQINYIKDNVQEFIKSIGKFARILDDVIQIATYYNKKEHKTNNANRNQSTHIIKNMIKNDSNMTNAKVEKLKKLILNYNVLQNKFIHQIYIILNNLDSKIPNRYAPQSTVYNQHKADLNKTDAIEINSANIIKNIRKLKQLAERINIQRRSKRETIDDDDALEYLLILMEYLLKRHNPTYPSVNDGLDLLIEAIKSAPDIKITRNKVVDYTTQNSPVTRTTFSMNSFKKYNNYSSSDTARDLKNDLPEINKSKLKPVDRSEDDIEYDEDKIEQIYRSFKSQKYSDSEQIQDDTRQNNNNTSISGESYKNVRDATTHALYITSPDVNNEVLQYKAINDSLEDEFVTYPSSTIAVEFDETSANPIIDYSNVIIINNLQHEAKGNKKNDNFLVDSKANSDWIEENFKEIKQFPETEIVSTTTMSLHPTRSYKPYKNKSNVRNKNKKHLAKMAKSDMSSTEEIMSKKQMDLINSVDYGEFESDSKDDKFSSDTYV